MAWPAHKRSAVKVESSTSVFRRFILCPLLARMSKRAFPRGQYPASARVRAHEGRGKNGRERGRGLVVFGRGRRIGSRGRQLAHPPTGQRTIVLNSGDRRRPIRRGGPIRIALRRSVDVPV